MPYPAPHLNVVTEELDEPTSTGNIETGHGDSVASNIPTTVHFVGSSVDPDIEPEARSAVKQASKK